MAQSEKTDSIQEKRARRAVIDTIDRKILGELATDAAQSFATLGEKVNLSAPAVHERVKRMRAGGAIKGTVAMLDGKNVGKPLLAFVHVDTTGWGKTPALMKLAEMPEVEEIHSSAGDACLIMKVRVASSEALEGMLARLYSTEGVRGTRTYVTLSTHVERGVQAGISAELEETTNII